MSGGMRVEQRGSNRAKPGAEARKRYGKKNSQQAVSKPLLFRTLFLLAVCGIVAFVVLAVRLYDIQIVNNSYFTARSLSGQLRQTTLPASRGTIFDAGGRILAMSGPVENIFISPLEMAMEEQDVRFIAEGLSYLLGVDIGLVIERASRTASQYQVIKPRVNADEAERVRQFIRDHNIRGVHFEPAQMRFYPNDVLASQVLGFVGTDDSGLDGLEQRFNSQLTGVDGRMIRLTNARGSDLMLAGFGDYHQARHGNDITLTINLSIQHYVEKHLAQAVVDYDVQNGAVAIAMDPRTGEILAIANYPTFDPNNFLRLSDSAMGALSAIEDEYEFQEAYRNAQFDMWRNRALTDTYEPGSVFKMITFAMGLEENVGRPYTLFDCRGHIGVRLFDGESIRNCHNRWGHGSLTMNEAMYRSCNVASIDIGLRVGARTFYHYIEAFGLFDRTGLDNAVEGRSLWWSENAFFDWQNHTQLASASFGQTFRITPIQMITAAAATINGGYLMQPFMVRQIADSDGNLIEVNEPTMVRQVISNETSAAMRAMLEGSVTEGTGRNAQVRGFRIGGKTGTSENVEQLALRGEDDTSDKDYIVSFLGFAPADDPQIVILVLLDTPSHETGIRITGGTMAAPVVGKMMADILPMTLGIMPVFTEADFPDINLHVPRLSGRDIESATSVLSASGFSYRVVGSGSMVTGQIPMPNAYVASGAEVIIYAGEDVPREMVTVPHLVDMSYTEARNALAGRGLFIRTAGIPRTDSRARVSIQSISAGREVQFGAVVEVTLINPEASEQ
ncbi:MAG: penicillin-binding transpeptidase domain-containing protein [Oscillospiraceae bacterium]|nr:penicillin-binding transpeptidase domain-containing protein [Oscillospiraceae bacterium]MCL2278086.1 penicillin-binding transpeptidase domain-containing protein [Oscillospiraceae bacterium]